MDSAAIERMASLEDRHWWFVARRRVVSSVIQELGLPPDASILEAGCGTGGNLAMLSRFGRVSAFEPNALALGFAAKRSTGTVLEGAFPSRIPFDSGSFDLVVAMDVLEHVDDDRAAMGRLFDMLKPGGHGVFTVPALPVLWSRHDEVHHHKRRYTRGTLRALIASAGFRLLRMTYYNSLLFPVVAAVRAAKWLLRADSVPDEKLPPEPVNGLLTALFSSESWMLSRMSFPIGTSLLAVVTRAR